MWYKVRVFCFCPCRRVVGCFVGRCATGKEEVEGRVRDPLKFDWFLHPNSPSHGLTTHTHVRVVPYIDRKNTASEGNVA